MTADREREGDCRIEVCSGDVPDRVDHHHDHEPEAERHAKMSELVRLGVHHDRAAAGEDERKGSDELGREQSREGAMRRERVRHASRSSRRQNGATKLHP